MRPTFAALLALTLALPLPAACAAPGSAAEAEAGRLDVSWSIEADAGQRAKDRVQFALTRRTANSRWTHSNTRPLADFPGLTAAQLATDSGMPVSFRFQRDAGTILCEGAVRRWRGTGDCSFQAGAGFAEALAERGHGRADESQLFSFALYDIGYAFLDELKRQGYARATVADLVRGADHGVDLAYLKAMGEKGYRVGSLAALSNMRDHGVTPDYVFELARLGVGDLSADEVVRLRDHGVTADYLGALKGLGYSGLAAADIVRLRDHGVTADFIRRANAGGRRRSADELVALRDGGWAER